MGRPVVLSNGQLFVGLNKHGLVHDFYYPYVGLENLTTTRSERHKIGVWIDGVFSWVNDETWEMELGFEADALVSTIIMRHKDLKVELHFRDFVDSELNAFCRQIRVVNKVSHKREIRLFMHQVFQISRAGRGDTALYEPEGNYILDYKGRCSLLIYAQGHNGEVFDQYAVGTYGIEGKEGTYRDAEDGELSNNPVEHGGVDSVIRLSLTIAGSQARTVDYWVACAPSQQDAEVVHEQLKSQGLDARLRVTRKWWEEWLAPALPKIKEIDRRYQMSVKKSLLVIKAHTDRRGGILASGDSSIFNYGRDYYCYCWPRDGAYAIWPLIRLGYQEEARNFFEFCRDTMHEDGYMMHKYQPDRAIGSTWHPLVHNNRRELAIQEDETAIVLIMLGEYLKYTNDTVFVELLYQTMVRPAAQFMSRFVDDTTRLPHASYDLWEEKFLTTTYTTATVYAALKAAAKLAEQFNFPDDALAWKEAAFKIEASLDPLFNDTKQYYRKGIILQPNGMVGVDETLDMSSFYGMMMFGPKSQRTNVAKTVDKIEVKLLSQSPSGGAPRYENDNYMRTNRHHLGNPWFICTMWLAQYYHAGGQTKQAHAIMQWVNQHMLETGMLSEQLNSQDGSQVGVAPLVWSHAEYINTALDLADL